MSTETDRLLKKGDAAKFFGYSVTAGYRYLDYLVSNKLLTARFLPGLAKPRFYLSDLKRIAENTSAEVSVPFYSASARNPTQKQNGNTKPKRDR
jgi:pantothenate kinase-related protein Tda10